MSATWPILTEEQRSDLNNRRGRSRYLTISLAPSEVTQSETRALVRTLEAMCGAFAVDELAFARGALSAALIGLPCFRLDAGGLLYYRDIPCRECIAPLDDRDLGPWEDYGGNPDTYAAVGGRYASIVLLHEDAPVGLIYGIKVG